MKKNEIESQTKKIIKILIEEFILAPEDKKKIIANIIDRCASELLIEYQRKYNNEIIDILEGFLDFHHWGDDHFPTTYTLADVKKIYSKMM